MIFKFEIYILHYHVSLPGRRIGQVWHYRRRTVPSTSQKPIHFDGHYLRNRSTLDICVLRYIGIVWPKEHSPEVSHIPPVTLCIYVCSVLQNHYLWQRTASKWCSFNIDMEISAKCWYFKAIFILPVPRIGQPFLTTSGRRWNCCLSSARSAPSGRRSNCCLSTARSSPSGRRSNCCLSRARSVSIRKESWLLRKQWIPCKHFLFF